MWGAQMLGSHPLLQQVVTAGALAEDPQQWPSAFQILDLFQEPVPWSARLAQAAAGGGLCWGCMQFPGVDGFCSVCFAHFQSVGLQSQAAIMGRFTPAPADEEMRSARALVDKSSTKERLNGLVFPLTMPHIVFSHFVCSLQRGGRSVTPAQLAKMLLDSGHPLLTAEQASQLIEALRVRGADDWRFLHVTCSRVLDKWNLTEKEHGIGCFYHGYERPIWIGMSVQATLGIVVKDIVKLADADSKKEAYAGGPSAFWDQDMMAFLQEKIRDFGIHLRLEDDPIGDVVVVEDCEAVSSRNSQWSRAARGIKRGRRDDVSGSQGESDDRHSQKKRTPPPVSGS